MFTPLRKQTSPKHYNARNEVIDSIRYVSAGREKTRVLGDATKYLFPMSRLDKTHMKPDWVEPVNRFRLTETIYMKLKCFALDYY